MDVPAPDRPAWLAGAVAPARGEQVAKYNERWRIDEEPGCC
jgi:hypothetical protein